MLQRITAFGLLSPRFHLPFVLDTWQEISVEFFGNVENPASLGKRRLRDLFVLTDRTHLWVESCRLSVMLTVRRWLMRRTTQLAMYIQSGVHGDTGHMDRGRRSARPCARSCLPQTCPSR